MRPRLALWQAILAGERAVCSAQCVEVRDGLIDVESGLDRVLEGLHPLEHIRLEQRVGCLTADEDIHGLGAGVLGLEEGVVLRITLSWSKRLRKSVSMECVEAL